jgi:hypothetical protein
VPLVGDHHGRIAVGQQRRQFGVGAARVQWHTDRRGPGRGEETLDQFDAVVQAERDPLAALDPEPGGQHGGPVRQLRPAHLAPVVGERGLFAVPHGVLGDQRRHGADFGNATDDIPHGPIIRPPPYWAALITLSVRAGLGFLSGNQLYGMVGNQPMPKIDGTRRSQ